MYKEGLDKKKIHFVKGGLIGISHLSSIKDRKNLESEVNLSVALFFLTSTTITLSP